MADSMKNMLYNQSDLASCSIMALNAGINLKTDGRNWWQ